MGFNASFRLFGSQISPIRSGTHAGLSDPLSATGSFDPCLGAPRASPRRSLMKARTSWLWFCCRFLPMRSPAYRPLHIYPGQLCPGTVRAARRSARRLCPLLTSAHHSGRLAASFVQNTGLVCRPPEVSSTAFDTCPPDIPANALTDKDFAFLRTLVRVDLPRIRFLFVGPCLCTTLPSDLASRRAPLRVASTSPPSGCAGDLHPRAVEHARHT